MKDLNLPSFFLPLFFSLRLIAQDTLSGNPKTPLLTIGIRGALVANNSLNYRYQEVSGDQQYHKEPGSSICYGFSSGFLFLLGRSNSLKQIISLGYDLAQAKFNNAFIAGYGGGRDYLETHTTIARTSQYFSLGYGVLIGLADDLHISLEAAFNHYYKQTDLVTGYSLHKGINNITTGQTFYDSTLYSNTPVVKYNLQAFASFRICLSYDIPIGEKALAIFSGVTMASGYKSSWWMLGLQYYPFKRLREK